MSAEPFERSLSSSSMASSITSSAPIPFTRRRLSPDQIQSLQTLYEIKAHPTKEDRVNLARELNMDLKAVNVWFQNKRRSMKKKCIAWNRATALMAENAFGMGHRYFSTPANPSRQKSLLRRNSAISLDTIASSRERRESLATLRPPLTPRKNIASHGPTSTSHHPPGKDSETHLWDHLLSSPILPPSSPTKESDLLSNLPSRSKTMKSLEWACAKDRVGRAGKTTKHSTKRRQTDVRMQVEEERAGVPELDLDSLDDSIEPDDTLTTPDHSVILSIPEEHDGKSVGFKDETPRAEDVEAAMALLGFKVYNPLSAS